MKPRTLRITHRIALPKDFVARIQKFLDGPGEDSDEVVETITVDFGSTTGCCGDHAIEADIKICDVQTADESIPYIDPVLFDNGSEVALMEVGDSLLGEYTWDYDGIQYVAILVEDES